MYFNKEQFNAILKIVHNYIIIHSYVSTFVHFIKSSQFAIKIWSFVLPYIILLRVSKYIWEGAFFTIPYLIGKMHTLGYIKFQHSYAGSCIKWYAFVGRITILIFCFYRLMRVLYYVYYCLLDFSQLSKICSELLRKKRNGPIISVTNYSFYQFIACKM